jgi:hypothetical protein
MVLSVVIRTLQRASTTKADLLNAAEVLEGQAIVIREVASMMNDGDTIAKMS